MSTILYKFAIISFFKHFKLMKKTIFIMAFLACTFSSTNAQTVDEQFNKELKELISVTNAKDVFYTSVYTQLEAQKEALGLSSEQVKELCRRVTDKIYPLMIGEYAKLYKSYFTIDEIKKINAFYRSPEGSKMAKFTPIITKECAEIGLKFAPQMQEVMLEYIQSLK